MMRSVSCSLVLFVIIAAGVALLPAEAPRVVDLIGEYRADERSLHDAYRLPWSELQNERLGQSADGWLQRLDGAPFESLSHDEQVDWLLLRNHLQQRKAGLARERRQLAEMETLLRFRSVIQKLEADRQRRTPVDAAQAAADLTALVKPLQDLKKQIEEKRKTGGKKVEAPAASEVAGTAPKPADNAPEITPVLALRAARATDAIRDTLAQWFKFYDGYQPDFGWWVREPQGKLKEALEAHAKFLREEIAGQKGKPEDPLVGDPLGAAELAAEIAGELLPCPAEELIGIGEREFAWCEDRLREVAGGMGTGTAGVIQKVKAAHVPPGEQDNLVAAEAERAIAFLKKHDLVSIPPLCEETWRMQMIPPEMQKTLPYAVYSQPSMMVAYATEAMPHEDKLMSMRGNNRHFTRIVTPHELIPGHHLQRFVAQRNRPWRSLFSTPFYVEGWALHWEMLLWDRGYADSPEDKAGMLFWRMHRCARIIVSLKFHLGRMTPAEMVDFLVQRVGHEKMGATSEVRRYIGGDYGPLYQAGYMLGGLQIRALYRELVTSGKMAEKAFHDAVLAQGSIPVELLRAALTNAPLTRDWKSTWRFADQ